MRTKLLFSLLALVIALGAIGYSVLHGLRSGEQQPSQAATTTIATSTDFYSIDAAYPQEPRDTAGAMKQYVSQLVAQREADWKDGSEVWKAEQDIAKQFPDRPAMQYQMMITYRTEHAPALDIVSYIFEHYEFTGGAHGGTDLATFAFGPHGPLAIDQIIDFDHGNDIALTRLLATKLAASLGEYANAGMMHDGLGLAYLRADDTFDAAACGCDGFFFPSNFQHFYITDTGITFIMGQYQVAPYVAGLPEASFTWAELAPYLLPGSGLPGAK